MNQTLIIVSTMATTANDERPTMISQEESVAAAVGDDKKDAPVLEQIVTEDDVSAYITHFSTVSAIFFL